MAQLYLFSAFLLFLLCFVLCGTTYYNDAVIITSFSKNHTCIPHSWVTSSVSGSSEQWGQVSTKLYYMLLDALVLPRHLNSWYISYIPGFFYQQTYRKQHLCRVLSSVLHLLHLSSKWFITVWCWKWETLHTDLSAILITGLLDRN